MVNYIRFLVCCLTIYLFSGCSGDVPDHLKPKPGALGKINEVVIISDDALWDGIVGDSLRYYFESSFPVLPRPEPVFDLRQFSIEEINAEPLLKQLRTYLVVGVLNDKNSTTSELIRNDLKGDRVDKAYSSDKLRTSVGTNKWATGQIVVYLFAPSEDDLLNSIGQYYPSIAKRVNQHDENAIEASVYAKGENKGLSQKVLNELGLHLKVPLDFVEAKYVADDKFIWLRKDTREVSMGLTIQKITYHDQSQFSIEYVKSLRDVYGKKYVSSSTEGSYMATNDQDLPIFEYPKDSGEYYKREYRGIWEMTDDFMGGPFISYMILDEKNNAIFFCDGFVYGPGAKKRNSIQQLDYIMNHSKPE